MTSQPPIPTDCVEAFELAMGEDFTSHLARERAVTDAIETFREALAREPHNARLWMHLGELELDRGASREARRAFRQVLRLEPRDALAHSGLAYAYAQLGRSEEAEKLLERALGFDPSDLLFCQLASLLLEQGRIDEADHVLRSGLELYPENEEILFLLARFCAQDEREARELLERALSIEPNHLDALVELGMLFASVAEPARAERCLRRAIELAPDLADGYRELATLRMETDLQSAIGLLHLALERDPNDPRGWTLLGEALWREGEPESAESALCKGCAIRPMDADVARAHWVLGRFFEDRGRPSEAIETLRCALVAVHHWPAVAADLGRLSVDAGDLAAAGWYLHLALEHDTDDEPSRELLRAIG